MNLKKKKRENLLVRAKEDFMQPVKIFLALEEICLSEKSVFLNLTEMLHKYHHTILNVKPLWLSLLFSALSQLASQLCWVGERPVNHLDLNDPKGPASLGLGQFWTSVWLRVDGFALCRVCVSVFVCVHGDGHPLQIYNRARVVHYQTKEGELVKVSSWDLLVLSCQGKFRNFNIVCERRTLKKGSL